MRRSRVLSSLTVHLCAEVYTKSLRMLSQKANEKWPHKFRQRV